MVSEQEIIQHLLTLPREVRQHLVATYNDAATLFRETMSVATNRNITLALERQQFAYARIASALLNSVVAEGGDES